jgi:hypothetical protein
VHWEILSCHRCGCHEADDEVYNFLTKDNERLLSIDESKRFIFSHSAFHEGWDNPNAFQICTLNESKSLNSLIPVSREKRDHGDLLAQATGFTAAGCVLTTSLTRNKSVRSARRWIDAFRLSIN